MRNIKNLALKITITIIIILLIINISFAETERVNDYNNYSSVTLNFNLDGTFSLVKTSANARVEEVTSYLTFTPKDDSLQKVDSINFFSTPTARISQDAEETTFKWENPQEEEFRFGLNSQVTINNALVTINKKIPFPLENVESNYLDPTEFIDVTPEIKAQAEEIAEGEDDEYVVAFKVGSWVNKNINYNLTTLTADVVQKSSWVLQKREGVCDELTNLFISMMRSLGIPARFVTGMAYTNLGHKWGPHGWAEVYFPDKGWVPFDVTYGQLGWIDPTHIKVKVSADSGDAAIRYTWRAIDTTVEGKEINLVTNLRSKGETISSPLKFTVKPLVNNVGPGSYVPLELDVKNNNDYYIPDSFIVTKATDLTESNVKATLLKPGETKKIFWTTKIPNDIREGYTYTSTIEIEDLFHSATTERVTYAENLDTITLEEAQQIIKENSEELEQKIISRKLDLICTTPRTAFSYEEINLDCKVKNKGNSRLNSIQVCYKENCQTLDLGIAEEKDVQFTLNFQPGKQNIIVQAKSGTVTASDVLNIDVLENPALNISNINYPKQIDYKDQFNITMVLTTKAPVENVKIKINDQDITEIPELKLTKQIIIETTGRDIYDNNKIRVKIEYKDDNNKTYNFNSEYNIEIKGIPWYIKLLSFLHLI